MPIRERIALDLVTERLAEARALEAKIVRTRPSLDGVGGISALDVADAAVRRAVSALEQAEEELEVIDGLYLVGDAR